MNDKPRAAPDPLQDTPLSLISGGRLTLSRMDCYLTHTLWNSRIRVIRPLILSGLWGWFLQAF